MASSQAQTAPDQTQVIEFRPGWNLVSVQVGDAPIPFGTFLSGFDDPEKLIEVWGYQPTGDPLVPGRWGSRQPTVPGFPTSDLPHLEQGRGYWVNVTSFATATLNAPAWGGAVDLVPGWNLVGFPGLAPNSGDSQDLASVLGAAFQRISQVWTFEPTTQQFLGYDTTAVPMLNELNSVRPARGYWVYALEALTISPGPYILLPPDADASPLQPLESFSAADPRWLGGNPADYVGRQVRFRDPGGGDDDFDLNGNGILDSPFTQDTLHFDIGVDRKVITVGNDGAGVVNWILVNEIPWLFAARPDPRAYPGNAGRPKTASGAVASQREGIILYADTRGLAPGRHTGAFSVFAGAASKTVTVLLDVPTAGGDWKGFATTQRVNGKDIPIGAVDLGLNLFMLSDAPEENRFRAVLNRDESLLFPKDVFMNGVFYTDNDFSLTTTFEMPPGDRNAPPYDTFQKPANYDSLPPSQQVRQDFDANNDGRLDVQNPFPFPVRRELTLIGNRNTPGRMEGSYVESITGILPNQQPIFIEGTFFLDRQTLAPTKRSIFNQTTTGAPILIGGTTGTLFRETTLDVGSAVSIQGVTLTLNLNFPDPTLLTITLTGPTGRSVLVHNRGPTLPTSLDLSEFNGLLGEGPWKLRVAWVATGERGNFNSWGLDIQGLATYGARGRILGDLGAGDVPLAGAHLVLSGSNLIEQTMTDADGFFQFGNLTENNYTLAVSRPGFETRLISFFLNNANLYLGQGGAVADLDDPDDPLVLTPVSVPAPELRPAPFIGVERLHVNLTALVPIADLVSLGEITGAVWDFGDGSPPVSADADPEDAVTQTTAKHIYERAGVYTATLTLTGTDGSLPVASREILVQRVVPDPDMPPSLTAEGTTEAPQVVAVSQVGAFAAPLSDAGAAVQVAEGGLVSQSMQIRQADGSYATVTLPGIAKGVVQQESKRDAAAFDIDRPPLLASGRPFSPDEEDSDFGDPARLVYVSGDGSVSLPFLVRPYGSLTADEQDFAEAAGDLSPGVYATYHPRLVNDQPIPERFRVFTTLGGAVFHPQPSRVGAFVLQTGRTEP